MTGVDPIILGRAIANTKASDDLGIDACHRLYTSLSIADRIRCLKEVADCNIARRGGIEAQITGLTRVDVNT